MSKEITIGFDYSHNNMLTLEASSYADFTQFLFSSAYKLGKIEAGFYSLDKIKDYDMIIMSIPRNINIRPKELDILEEYVKNGGGLLVIGARGGEYLNRTNINELLRKFGFEFVTDEIFDSVSYVNLQKRPIFSNFNPHYITENLKKIVLSSSCSIKTLGISQEESKARTEVLVRGGINCWRNRFDGKEWVEEDSPKIPLVVASEYYAGKVVAFGTISIFSSLGREYGFSAFDNDIIIANILRWLTLDIRSQGKVVTIDLQKDLFHWAEALMKEKNWDNFSNIINVSLKYFKDNYSDIINELETMRDEWQKAHPVEKVEKKKEVKEEDVIELIPQRKKEDLEEIIKSIEEITGESYERSIEFEEEDSFEDDSDNEELIAELPDDINTLTVKQLKRFCKQNNIELPSNARKSDIIKIIKYVLGID
ncbi:MAG: hypothetical protein EAX89_16205 [Candidatus Lokiarchaeota archaeon]|nr:hypothetical protein [Candidatus Lokiarchaeota archaeon]